MKLLTEELKKKLPPLYATDGQGNEAVVVAKFFTPDANWTWFVTEGSPVDEDGMMDTDLPKVDWIFFGLVDGLEVELGNFSLSELQEVRGRLGLPVERDLYWEPKTLAQVRKELGQ
jgi:hypothetical protein